MVRQPSVASLLCLWLQCSLALARLASGHGVVDELSTALRTTEDDVGDATGCRADIATLVDRAYGSLVRDAPGHDEIYDRVDGKATKSGSRWELRRRQSQPAEVDDGSSTRQDTFTSRTPVLESRETDDPVGGVDDTTDHDGTSDENISYRCEFLFPDGRPHLFQIDIRPLEAQGDAEYPLGDMLALLNRVRGGLEADVGRRFDELWAPHRDLEGDEPHRWEYEFRPSPHRHVPACVLVELLRRIASIGPPHGFAAQIFDVTPYGQMERHFNLGMVRMYQERHIPLPRVHTPYRPPRRRPHHEGTAGAVDPPFTPPTGIPAIPGVVHPWYATFQHYYQYWRTMQIAGGIMCPDSP